jgi:DNA-damage-inducible protein J
VESILSQLSITTTQAITIYFEQIKMNNGIPFRLKIPNDETIKAMKETRANTNIREVTLDELIENFSK